MSDADIVRQGFEHHTGPPPGTEEALRRLERAQGIGYKEGWAAGEAAYQKLFQEAIDVHGQLVDRITTLEEENARLRAPVRSFEIDECPECRSRTRSFHDMLWVGKWRGCLNPWHDE